jgi:hypothetical protein
VIELQTAILHVHMCYLLHATILQAEALIVKPNVPSSIYPRCDFLSEALAQGLWAACYECYSLVIAMRESLMDKST